MASHHVPPGILRGAAVLILSVPLAPVAQGAPAHYHTVLPCRVFDSRLPADAPALSSGVPRTIDIAGACTVPPEATSVALNLAVTQPDATGHLTLFAAGALTPPVSSINFSAGQTRANNAIVELSKGQIDALAVMAPSGTVHLILDVFGYFVDDVPPTGVDDTDTVDEDSPATTIDVLANDTDPDGGPISIDSVTQPGHGTVVITNGGADLTYQPTINYCNGDVFTYTLTPGGSTATVSVTVTCVNDPPVLAGAGMATFVEGGPPVAVAPGLTATDVDDTDLEAATVTIDNLMNPGAEILTTDTTGTAIVASYTAPTLTLSGTDTVANYQLVLRRVTYENTSSTPDATPRGVTFVANDGDLDSDPATATVDVVPSNDPPVLTVGGGSSTFTEDGPAVAVDPTLTATDVDDVDLESATVTITNLAETGSEVLAASTAGTAIVASYAAPTLTLTGTDTVANYQQVLRSVTYANTSQNPTPTARSIAFVANDGTANGNTATKTLIVTAVNDPPVVAAGGASPTFTEDGPAVVVDPALAVSDVDDASLESATVTITNILDFGLKGVPGGEVLAANTAGTAIVASYLAPTLTLTGTDTVANYRQVLRSVTYLNSSQNPTTTARSLAFVVDDGAAGSNTATTTVNLTAINDAPALAAGGGSPTFTEDGPPITIDPGLIALDVDNPMLASARVTITNLQDTGLEVLAATTAGTSIVASYAPPTLTLTGADTVANYQQVLRSVTYANGSDTPSTTARSLAFVANDGGLDSNTATTSVAVVGVSDAPVLTAGGGAPTFTEDGPAVTVDPGLTVTDADSTDLVSATVTITNLLNAGAEALAANTAGTSILASYTAPTLTLTGTDTLANYEQVLRSVTYLNTSQNPNTSARAIAFVANDGTSNSNTATTTVSVVAVNDAPALAGAGTVTFTEDAGAVAVAPGLSVTDVDDVNLESATVTITNLQDLGLEALAASTGGTAIVASYTAPTLTLTGTDTVANYQAVLQSVTYNNASQAPSLTDRAVSFVVNDGSVNGNMAVATVQVVPVNDPPALTTNPITYATAGNTQLHVAGDTLPGVASIADAQSALAKSAPTDVDGPLAPVVVAASGATANGGSFTIDTDGSFTYVPAAGFTGTDSFTYRVSDSVLLVTGTINVNVSSVVWYVRDVVDANNPAGGDGRSTDAFETLAAAEAAAGTGHFIFAFAGNTATTPFAGGIALKDGQKLHGEGVGLSVPGFTNIVAAGVRPRINNAAGDAVSVPATAGNRNGVEIRGLDLQAGADAVVAVASGSNDVGVTISDNTVRGAAQLGIRLHHSSTGRFVATVQGNTITATGVGFGADSFTTGQLEVDFSTNNVSSGAEAVSLNGLGSTPVAITGFADNTVSGDTVLSGILISNAIFDSIPGGALDQVSGGVTTIGDSGNGVGESGLSLNSVSGNLAFLDLDVFADAGVGFQLFGNGPFTGAAGTLVTVPPNAGTIRAVGGPAVHVETATVDLRLASITSTNSQSTGVSLRNVQDGTVDARFSAGSSSTISDTTRPALEVTGGNAGITYAGAIVTDYDPAIQIDSWSGDDTTDDLLFSGATTGRGIILLSNSGSRAITFSGSMDIGTPGAGFFASGNTNAGGLQVTGGPNTVVNTGLPALRVTNTTIGPAGLTFRSLSATGGTNGIVLTNTGTLGGLTVTGTGGAGTGGTIQNMTGDGITLTNTRSVSLSSMSITNNQGSGILGDDVTDFSLVGSSVTNNGNTADGTEAGLRFNELLGTCAITNSTISGSSEDNIRITPDSGVLTNLTISGSTIGPNSVTTGGNGITLLGTGTATATLTVTNSTFANNRGTAILSNFASTGSHTVGVSNSIFRDNGKAVSLASNTNTDLTFDVLNNTEIVRSGSNALELITSFDATSAMQARGTLSGNAIGNGTPDSGSADLHGIAIDLRGDERSILAVTNNSVRNVDLMGLFIQDADFGAVAGPPSDHDLTVRDNSVQDIDDNSGFPCAAPFGTLVDMRHTTVACLDMAGNTSAQSPAACAPPVAHFRLRQRDTSTFVFERLSDGDGTPGELINTVATVQAHAVAENDPGSTADVTLVTGFTEAANGTCVKP